MDAAVYLDAQWQPTVPERAVFAKVRQGKRIVFVEIEAGAASLKAGFDPSQPRDEQGRWSETGDGGIGAHSERRASLHLSQDERKKLAEAGLYLHGTEHQFAEFRPGGHTAIYFSDPSNDPSRITQAEHIAGGPFGGRLVAAKIDRENGKYFDPYNDPVAKEIWRQVYLPGHYRVGSEGAMFINYPDMPRIVELASVYGYNIFKVYEPAAGGYSLAVTDPSLITIVAEWIKDNSVVETKSVNEVLREYDDRLTRWIADAANGHLSGGEMSRAMKALIRRVAPEAYDEGLREGGITDPERERTEADDDTIEKWVGEQIGYVLDFARDAAAVSDLAGDAKVSARRAILDRAGQWVDSLRALGNLGYASAQKNTMGEWKLGATEQHCRTCSRLDGQSHRLSWFTSRGYIPRQPGSVSLDCGGWNCDCSIVAKSGRVLLP